MAYTPLYAVECTQYQPQQVEQEPAPEISKHTHKLLSADCTQGINFGVIVHTQIWVWNI